MGELLNLVGFSTGVVLYAMLLAMVVRAGRAPGAPRRFDPLLLATSLLGLIWNLCALPAYELPKVGVRRSVSRCSSPPASARSASCRPSSSTRCCAASTTACAAA